MVDAVVTMRAGEKAPVYATVSAATGHTVTIQVGASVTLTDTFGNPFGGINGAPVTGNDAGALATARAWYLLDTGPAGANLAVGRYVLSFRLPVLGDDGIARIYEPNVFVDVTASWG